MEDIELFLSSDEEDENEKSVNPKKSSRFSIITSDFLDLKYLPGKFSPGTLKLSKTIKEQERRIDNLEKKLRQKVWEISNAVEEKNEVTRQFDDYKKKMQRLIRKLKEKQTRELSSLNARIALLRRKSSSSEMDMMSEDVERNRLVEKEEEIHRLKEKMEEQVFSSSTNDSEYREVIRKLEKDNEMLRMTLSSDEGVLEFIEKELEELSQPPRKSQSSTSKPTRKERIRTLLTREKRYKKMKKILKKHSHDFIHQDKIINALKSKIIELSSGKDARELSKIIVGNDSRRNSVPLSVNNLRERIKALTTDKSRLSEKLAKEQTSRGNVVKKTQNLIRKYKDVRNKLKSMEDQNKKMKGELSDLNLHKKFEKMEFDKRRKKYESDLSKLSSMNKKLRINMREHIELSRKQKKLIEITNKKLESVSKSKSETSTNNRKNDEEWKKEKTEIQTRFINLLKTRIEAKDKEIRNLSLEYEMQIQEMNEKLEKKNIRSTGKRLMIDQNVGSSDHDDIESEVCEIGVNTTIAPVSPDRSGAFYQVLEREHEEMSIELEQYEIKFEELESIQDDLKSSETENKELNSSISNMRTELEQKEVSNSSLSEENKNLKEKIISVETKLEHVTLELEKSKSDIESYGNFMDSIAGKIINFKNREVEDIKESEEKDEEVEEIEEEGEESEEEEGEEHKNETNKPEEMKVLDDDDDDDDTIDMNKPEKDEKEEKKMEEGCEGGESEGVKVEE